MAAAAPAVLPPLRGMPRLERLSKPTRMPPVGFYLRREMRELRGSDAMSPLARSPMSATTPSPSHDEQTKDLTKSLSSPSLTSLPLLTPSAYKRHCGTIFGGLDYHRSPSRPDVKARYLDASLQKDNAELSATARKEAKAQEKLRDQLRRAEGHNNLMKENSSAQLFRACDEDGDDALSFAEFCQLLALQYGSAKEHIPKREVIENWFRLVDADCSGSLSFTEFFSFSLREALARSLDSRGLVEFLRLWDGEAGTILDDAEYSRATQKLGIGGLAGDIRDLCVSKRADGRVCLGDVLQVVRAKMVGSQANSFLSSSGRIARRAIEESLWSEAGKQLQAKKASSPSSGGGSKKTSPKARRSTGGGGAVEGHVCMDAQTLGAVLDAFDAAEAAWAATHVQPEEDSLLGGTMGDAVEAQGELVESAHAPLSILRSWMRKQGMSALEVFHEWDSGGSFALRRRNVKQGLRSLGLELNSERLARVFDYLTTEDCITFEEWKKWYDATSPTKQAAVLIFPAMEKNKHTKRKAKR